MKQKITCLVNLQNKVFKLLPMREAFDNGIDNHLYEYVENLYDNYEGALKCYEELSEVKELVEAFNNIAYLKTQTTNMKKWRSIVLRTTRLIHTALTRMQEE